jgi:hypothetical protein
MRIVVACLLAVVAGSARADDPTNGQFTWLKFKDKAGEEHAYPRWAADAKKADHVTLKVAKAAFYLDKDYTLERATLKVYLPSPAFKGAWAVDPAVTCVAPEPEDVALIAGPEAVAKDKSLNKWTITWIDSAKKPTAIPDGVKVKLELTITIKRDGKETSGTLSPEMSATAEARP